MEFLLDLARWPKMPALHRAFLEGAIPKLRAEARLVGLAAGGSFIQGVLDEHSDLDLVVIATPEAHPRVLQNAADLAARLGPLLASFVGEHVGEPRLLVCLYGPPLLHVDLKFVTPEGLAKRVEDPVVLWERDGRVRAGLAAGRAKYPQPNLQWIEDRFWPWVHYLVTKIARGELFEVLDGLAFLRARVFGPLILTGAGAQPNGVRRIEAVAPERVSALRSTLAGHDRAACRIALEAAIGLYVDLRERLAPPQLVRRSEAEREAREFLRAELGAGC